MDIDQRYHTVVTQIGTLKMTNAIANGKKVTITQFAVGDGNGSAYIPDETMTKLKNERWRGEVATYLLDESSPNIIKVVAVVPHDIGGFTVREMAVFDDENQMIAIAPVPDYMKVSSLEGVIQDVTFCIDMEVINASAVRFLVDPTVFYATKKELQTHNQSLSAHADKAQKDLTNVSASSILEKVKVVDGNGSGLDADTVDGKHASDFKLALKNGNYFLSNFGDTGITLGNGDNATFEACNMDIQSWYGIGIKPAAPSSSDIGRTVVINARNGEIKTKGQIYVDTNKKVWHEGNGGGGSGLDADMLDGKHAVDLQNYNNLTNKPNLKTVATSGNYNDLSNKPTIPTTLPANGGNADTVDGKHAEDFAPSGFGLGTGCINLPSNSDLNDLPEKYKNATGFFMGSALKNQPTELGSSWIYLLQMIHYTTHKLQIAFTLNGGKTEWGNIFIRQYINNVWSDWKKPDASTIEGKEIAYLLDYGNLTNKPTIPTTLPANGGNADTVDGKHAAVLYSNCSAAAPTSYLGDNVQYQVY